MVVRLERGTTSRLLAAAAVAGLALALGPAAPAAATEVDQPQVAGDAQLAARWAPIHYQDTDSSDYDADYLTRPDYDGEWDMLNNWEHQNDSLSRLRGWVTYSVVSTRTHWFLVYAFYHPRDWCDSWFCGYHENDMEGALLVVRRDGSYFGRFEAMVTVFHRDFYSFTPSGSPYTNGREDIDGRVRMRYHGGYYRPTTFQEAKGHGCKAWNGRDFPGGDGVVYYPDRYSAEVPYGGNDRFVRYRLVNTFATGGLWAHRYDSSTFAGWGTFRGDDGSDNAANSAWGWDDHDDGSDLRRGLLATDPAKLVSIYFGNEGDFSRWYTSNRYL